MSGEHLTFSSNLGEWICHLYFASTKSAALRGFFLKGIPRYWQSLQILEVLTSPAFPPLFLCYSDSEFLTEMSHAHYSVLKNSDTMPSVYHNLPCLCFRHLNTWIDTRHETRESIWFGRVHCAPVYLLLSITSPLEKISTSATDFSEKERVFSLHSLALALGSQPKDASLQCHVPGQQYIK